MSTPLKNVFPVSPPAAKQLGQELLEELSGEGGFDTQKALDLIAQGAALDEKGRWGYTALHWATSMVEGKRIIEALVARGAPLEARANEGWTPLMHAACNNARLESVKILIDSGAALDAVKDNGYTALMLTSFNGSFQCAEALIMAGANPDIRNNEGTTALDVARRWGQTATIQMLLDAPDRRRRAVAEAHEALMKKIEDDIKGGLKHDLPPITPLSFR